MRVLLLSLLSFAGLVAAQNGYPCTYTADDGAQFDFSSLTTLTGTTFKGTNEDVYAINVCGVAQGQHTETDSRGNRAAAGCERLTRTPLHPSMQQVVCHAHALCTDQRAEE